MSMTEIIERISDGKMKDFMNPPIEPDGLAYVQRNFKDDKDYVHCPYCGKKQFPVQKNTRIENLLYQCKNSKCKREFKIDLKGKIENERYRNNMS